MLKAAKVLILLGYFVSLAYAENFSASRQLVNSLKNEPRGPFSEIRWFCEDGSVQPAKRGCSGHGGGIQHGKLRADVQALRNDGYAIATIYADMPPSEFQRIRNNPRSLSPLLLERFLIAHDQGWIYKKAQFYRGSVQIEDEAKATDVFLYTLLNDAEWRTKRFLLLREAARLLPRERNHQVLSEIRSISVQLVRSDPGFEEIRNKIHAYPDAGDAQRVRNYAERKPANRRAPYLALASKIDVAYNADTYISDNFDKYGAEVSNVLQNAKSAVLNSRSAASKFEAYSEALLILREYFEQSSDPRTLLNILDASLDIEQDLFTLRASMNAEFPRLTRSQHVYILKAATKAIYGCGLLSKRAYQAGRAALQHFENEHETEAKRYREELMYLSLMPAWAASRFDWEYSPAVQKFAEIEPLVKNFIADRLRASPLLIFSQQVEFLLGDANRLNGIEHRFFGQTVSSGLRPLNPGIARGILAQPSNLEDAFEFNPASRIFLVPETVPDIPAVAGILTAREGNSLSHIQLLARSLGIPNVVVAENLLPDLGRRVDKSIVLAVSPAGRVLLADDGPKWNNIFKTPVPTKIEPDLNKLDLKVQKFISLQEIRREDSGRIVGPKAANLGELKSRFPDAVTDGVVIPFGLFAQVLNQRISAGPGVAHETTLMEWMKIQYQALKKIDPESPGYQKRVHDVLAFIRATILSTAFSDEFKRALRIRMEEELGPLGSYGVFVRSDTNVEDLATFTGAGLNLTVPNVVSFDQILHNILEVWASPFTERAFSWRQSHMDSPEHVYASVILLKSVPVEKSGVLVTANANDGDTNYMTIAVNEGVSGAVNNQFAEGLLVNRSNGAVRLMSEASQIKKNVVDPRGGLKQVETSGSDRVLSTTELVKLNALTDEVAKRYPPLRDPEGNALPADIEFGFIKGHLVLFQIRPFLQNEASSKNGFLMQMDRERLGSSQEQNGLSDDRMISLDEVPLRDNR